MGLDVEMRRAMSPMGMIGISLGGGDVGGGMDMVAGMVEAGPWVVAIWDVVRTWGEEL